MPSFEAILMLKFLKGGKFIKRYRSEWKYCEEEADLLAIKQRLLAVMNYDSHAGQNGNYQIHSIYFDDYKDTCARENIAGERKRFKYRIRYYNNASDKLWLEKKEKINNYCHKRKCPITLKEYWSIINGKPLEIFWDSSENLLKEFCTDIVTRHFVPKVIIDYEREAFQEIISNVRITLDYNISASDDIKQFLNGDYLKIPILEKKKHILEVKFDDVLPSYIKSVFL